VHLFSHVDGGYCCWGDVGGGSLRWYRDTFAPNHSYTELMDMANRSLLGEWRSFLPHLSGERSPHLDQILVVLGLICLWRIRRQSW